MTQLPSRPIVPKGEKPKRRKPVDYTGFALPKTNYFRSDEMMVAVRAFPCGNCGAINEGNCGAHPNWSWAGKGKSIKGHDLPATLCPACHVPVLDQGKDLDRAERELMWLRAFYRTQLHGFQTGVFEVVR